MLDSVGGYFMFRLWLLFSILATGLLYGQQFSISGAGLGGGLTNGLAWGDLDGDGFDDLFMSNGVDAATMQLNNVCRNNGDGSFNLSFATGAIVTEQYTSGGASWADLDNDGDLDIIVGNPVISSGGGNYSSNNTVHLNDGSGNFTQTSFGALTNTISGSLLALNARAFPIWADVDDDGDVDATISNSKLQGGASPNQIYLSTSGTSFSATSNNFTANTTGRGFFAWVDYDNDGDTDVATGSGVPGVQSNLWSWDATNYTNLQTLTSGLYGLTGSWGDYDSDGDLDLYIGIGGDNAASPMANKLFRNNGSGTLTEITSGVGSIITDLTFSYTSNWVDYDNDGDVDLFTGNDDADKSALYRNDNGVFTSVFASEFYNADYVHSGAWADYDNDGDMDLAVGRDGPNVLVINNNETTNPSNHWLEVITRGNGAGTNKSGIGALVRVNATINSSTYTQIRTISAGDTRGGHGTFRAHYGLGNATTTNTLSVTWPNSSNSVNTFSSVPADKLVYVAQIEADDEEEYAFPLAEMLMSFNNLTTTSGAIAAYKLNSAPTGNSFSGSALAPNGVLSTPDQVSPDKYWVIKNDGLSGYQIQITLDYAGISGVSNPDRLLLARRSGPGNPWIPANTNRSGTLLSAAFNSFGEFAVVSATIDNSLPVELTGMTVFPGSESVTLKWETQSEIENLGFIVERSADDLTSFTEIASYKTSPELKGQGNSSSATKYQYTDTQVQPEMTYWYRLIDVDINGTRTTHAAVEARTSPVASLFVLHNAYPNPFNPTTNIRFTVPASAGGKELTVMIYNSLGQLVKTLYSGQAPAGEMSLIWDATNDSGFKQSSGIYFLQVRNERFSKTQKLVLMQ